MPAGIELTVPDPLPANTAPNMTWPFETAKARPWCDLVTAMSTAVTLPEAPMS